MKKGYLLIFLCIISHSVWAQKSIHGIVTDVEKNKPLPSANIIIEGTYQGTVSNENGQYALEIPDSLLPATVSVRFIGYRSENRLIKKSSVAQQNFRLQPSVTIMKEITVTDENPAAGIMREVIERKKQWWKKLYTYQAEAYTRQTLANDTSIASITETASRIFWDKKQGHREVITSKRQTANISPAQNFAGVRYLPNFYDDNIQIAGFTIPGVTNPDALSFYNFNLLGQTSMDGKTVYKIQVIPARKLQPLFKGTIYVLEDQFVLLKVDLTPNDVVKFPRPVQSFTTSYQQQFNNYGKDFWLPVDIRINGNIEISMIGLSFPHINFKQISRITDYKVNKSLPDSLYKKDSGTLFIADTALSTSQSALADMPGSIPLSKMEKQAYASIDSSATLKKAFQPGGLLARFLNNREKNESDSSGFPKMLPGKLLPQGRFNRVDEVFLGLKYYYPLSNRIQLRGSGGYSTGYKKWSYGAGFTGRWLQQENILSSIGFDYNLETAPRYTSNIYKPFYASFANLLGNSGYFDYYRSDGFRAFSKWTYPSQKISLTLAFNHQKQTSLKAHTAYDFVGKKDNFRINPPIDEGTLQSIDIVTGYNLGEGYNFGITGRKYIRFEIEHSSPGLGSDFSFTQYETRMAWNFPTFFKRRLLPNTLDVGLKAGTYSGNLPFQKMGIIDGALGIISPYGILRALRGVPYQGKQYAALHIEHNFRSVPFEMLGLRPLVERSIGLIIFGGAAKTWGAGMSKQEMMQTGYQPNVTQNIHWEAGLSINRILGILRLDFAARLDQPAFLINIGIARLF